MLGYYISIITIIIIIIIIILLITVVGGVPRVKSSDHLRIRGTKPRRGGGAVRGVRVCHVGLAADEQVDLAV